jgi:type II secretory pathway component PulC
MSLKYLFLNILLCFVIFLIAIKNYEIWNRSVELLPNTGIVPKKAETKNENPPMTASTKEMMPVQSYVSISEKNIFSPERKDFPIVAVDKSNPVTRPQVILYGVTIAGDFQAASVVSPGRSLQKGERETLTLKLGEKIGGYQLAKVLPDRIAMESNGDMFEVLLYDPKNPKRKKEGPSETKSTKSAIVASAQPSSIPPSAVAPSAIPSQESIQKPKVPYQAQGPPSLPFNKYTYQLSPPSAAIRRGRILTQPSGTSIQETPQK